MKLRLRTVLSLQFALLVLITVFLISLVSGNMINRQFEEYVTKQQKSQADDLADSIESHYDPNHGGWNVDYVHGMGMYALKDGFVIRLYDAQKVMLWDAENHDMAFCHKMLNKIAEQMKEKRPELEGKFVNYQYNLNYHGEKIGFLEISYYTPYYMNEHDFQFVAALNRILGIVGGLSLIFAVVLGMLLARQITRPLSEVVRMTRRIAEGNYTTRLRTDRSTLELYELTDSVNRMAASLSEQETLRKQLTSDIEHELRTPVANISSYMEMMLEGVLEPTTERLQNCYNELKRLTTLIADLKHLKNEEASGVMLDKEKTGLLDLASVVLKSFETQLHENHIEWRLEGENVFVSADTGRLQQVIANLLSNAIKYTDAGGSIRISVTRQDAYGVLYVEDSGIGIPKDEQERIFERFYRTDKSRTRKTGGTGIGLSIAKAIVQAHQGTITCESEVGKGSRFIVRLPVDHEKS